MKLTERLKEYEDYMKLIYPDKYEGKHINPKTCCWAKDKPEKQKKIKKHKIKANKELREEILKRDGYKCTNCGSSENLHVHHIQYRSNGGTNDPSNLTSLCKYCHANIHKNEAVYKIMIQ